MPANEEISELEALAVKCPEIAANANYWFLRTEGGTLYEAFVASNSIAIGYPEIRLKDLLSADGKNGESYATIKAIVQQRYPNKKSAAIVAYQMVTFTQAMKAGDFVIIPSFGTSTIGIGVITGDPLFEEILTSGGKEYPDFRKRRRVEWIISYPRHAVNPNIWKILNTHQTIVEATAYGRYIDPLIYDLFKKGNKYHFCLRVRKQEGIGARDLFFACADLIRLADELSAEEKIKEDSGDIEARINLNSPGDIELVTSAAKYICLVSAIVIFINGGGLKMKVAKMGLDLNLSTSGIMKAVSHFLNEHKNRKMAEVLEQKLKELKLESSAQVENLIKAVKLKDKNND